MFRFIQILALHLRDLRFKKGKLGGRASPENEGAGEIRFKVPKDRDWLTAKLQGF